MVKLASAVYPLADPHVHISPMASKRWLLDSQRTYRHRFRDLDSEWQLCLYEVKGEGGS